MSVISVVGRASLRLPSLLSPSANFSATWEAVARLWKNRNLTHEMVRRDLSGQFAGQILGKLWVLIHPLILFGIYLTVFAAVLRVRIQPTADMPHDYATYILTGLSAWLSIQQALARATGALMGQSNLVKQVVFPIEVLPLSITIVSMIPLVIGIVIIAAYTLLMTHALPLTYLLLPVALCLSLMLLTGLAFILAVGTPFLRDLKDIVSVLTVVGVYVVPAFYLPQWIPHLLRPLIYLNPFSYVIWVYQDILYYGRFEHPAAWCVFIVGSLLIFPIGYRIFRSLKPYVANVL